MNIQRRPLPRKQGGRIFYRRNESLEAGEAFDKKTKKKKPQKITKYWKRTELMQDKKIKSVIEFN